MTKNLRKENKTTNVNLKEIKIDSKGKELTKIEKRIMKYLVRENGELKKSYLTRRVKKDLVNNALTSLIEKNLVVIIDGVLHIVKDTPKKVVLKPEETAGYAWELVREKGITLSEALKIAWSFVPKKHTQKRTFSEKTKKYYKSKMSTAHKLVREKGITLSEALKIVYKK